jgi:ABC-type multidrug transport system ATPase subunit
LFGLAAVADRRLSSFSSGMIQKVGLAQSLIKEPRVLLLDEPTSGLDPIGRQELLELIARLARDGVTVLFLHSHSERHRTRLRARSDPASRPPGGERRSR